MTFERVQSLEEEFDFRASYYFLLSNLLSAPPTCDTLETLGKFGVSDAEATSNFLVKLNALVAAAGIHTDVEKLDDEYHDLFIGIGRGEIVPYGSWYITGMLMDKPLSLLRQDLNALGIQREQSISEPEDHISALMDTMGIVIQASDDFQFKTQQTLFTRHIKPWAKDFFKDLTTARKADFYTSVGEFGVEFINLETEYLEMPV